MILKMHWSQWVLVLVLTVGLSHLYSAELQRLGPQNLNFSAFGITGLLVLPIASLIHEMGHAVVALRHRIPIREIRVCGVSLYVRESGRRLPRLYPNAVGVHFHEGVTLAQIRDVLWGGILANTGVGVILLVAFILVNPGLGTAGDLLYPRWLWFGVAYACLYIAVASYLPNGGLTDGDQLRFFRKNPEAYLRTAHLLAANWELLNKPVGEWTEEDFARLDRISPEGSAGARIFCALALKDWAAAVHHADKLDTEIPDDPMLWTKHYWKSLVASMVKGDMVEAMLHLEKLKTLVPRGHRHDLLPLGIRIREGRAIYPKGEIEDYRAYTRQTFLDQRMHEADDVFYAALFSPEMIQRAPLHPQREEVY